MPYNCDELSGDSAKLCKYQFSTMIMNICVFGFGLLVIGYLYSWLRNSPSSEKYFPYGMYWLMVIVFIVFTIISLVSAIYGYTYADSDSIKKYQLSSIIIDAVAVMIGAFMIGIQITDPTRIVTPWMIAGLIAMMGSSAYSAVSSLFAFDDINVKSCPACQTCAPCPPPTSPPPANPPADQSPPTETKKEPFCGGCGCY